MSQAAPHLPSTTTVADDTAKKELRSHAPQSRTTPATGDATLSGNDNETTPSRGKNGQFRKKEKNTVVAPETSGATARCRDGSLSHSQQHRGACSRHGGVDQWLSQ
ncbi:DUF3761 domain-containing protein [Enterobacter hormaechei]|nr:DUF3761 domain-containing protein [Enterobacter hormaechei]